MTPDFVLCDSEAVRQQHGRMFRRLNRQLGVHKHALTSEGWHVLTRAAFSLYLDSLDRQLPLFSEEQFPSDLGDMCGDAADASATDADVHQRVA